jgi:hypothetical protein
MHAVCRQTDELTALDEALLVYGAKRQAKPSVCWRGFVRDYKRFLLCNAQPRDVLLLLYSNYSRTTC